MKRACTCDLPMDLCVCFGPAAADLKARGITPPNLLHEGGQPNIVPHVPEIEPAGLYLPNKPEMNILPLAPVPRFKENDMGSSSDDTGEDRTPVPTLNPDAGKEFVAYYVNLLGGTNRSERFYIEEGSDTTAAVEARRKAEVGEEIFKVEECKPRRYRVGIKVTKSYVTYVETEEGGGPAVDCFEEARAEAQHQIDNWQDGKWDDQGYNEAEIVHMEEIES